MALTTLPANEGCRSPKKLMARPSRRIEVSIRATSGFGVAFEPRQFERCRMAPAIGDDFFGRKALSKPNAFLHGQFDFLVVERVAGRIDHALAVGDGYPAPRVQQPDE